MSDVEVCILAGGLSARMGREKSRVRLGRRTLLGHVRANAAQLGLPVRVLRRDIVPRCGPLGGVYSAVKTSRRSAIIFLACDMPFVSGGLLEMLLSKFESPSPRPLPQEREKQPSAGKRAVFAAVQGVPGFPVILPRSALPVVEAVMSSRSPSLRNLAAALKARLVRVPSQDVININSPEDLASARKRHVSAQDQLVKLR